MTFPASKPLTIYEVVSGGTKSHHPSGGEDWSVLVAAHSPSHARDIAYGQTEIDHPWVIYEWGTDARPSAKPGVLRGPFENCPALCRGWKMYHEDSYSEEEPAAMVDWVPDNPPVFLKLPDERWMPELLRCLAVDAMRRMRNSLRSEGIVSDETYQEREEDIEAIIQRLASDIERQGMAYIKVEQER